MTADTENQSGSSHPPERLCAHYLGGAGGSGLGCAGAGSARDAHNGELSTIRG